MRFRAEQHLRRQRDIQAVREQGRRIDCGPFTLWYRRRPAAAAPVAAVAPAEPLPSPGKTETALSVAKIRSRAPRPEVPAELRRVCFIASTAAVGDAVARARARRRMREVFRHHQDAVPPGYDLLLIARKSINGLEYREIERKFIEACPRIAPRIA
ncbi:MAG: ribonuclease P protein component [Opitutaceae bacterium]|nr:ribonuclease P protein component [Opitutaceae bacterium]